MSYFTDYNSLTIPQLKAELKARKVSLVYGAGRKKSRLVYLLQDSANHYGYNNYRDRCGPYPSTDIDFNYRYM